MITMMKSQFFIILLLLITVASLGAAGYFYSQLEQLRANSALPSTSEIEQIVSEVSKLAVLPEDEQPTLATVDDPEQLRDQPFFAKAKKGDKVLVYNKALKAILYDPIQHKIIEIAPINNPNQ